MCSSNRTYPVKIRQPERSWRVADVWFVVVVVSVVR